jgi:DNA-binding MarR family transcriptional regulator
LTDGNLSRHLQVLEGAKLVEISKSHVRNRPQTLCRITVQGRKRYINYLAILEQVILDAADGIGSEPESKTASALSRS